jgi:hypothetical protein
MSQQTRQTLEVLLSLSPWIVFIAAALWCFVLALRDDLRSARARSHQGRRSAA